MLLLIFFLSSGAGITHAFSKGPLPYRNQFPLALLFFSFEADSAYIQEEKISLRSEISYSGIFEKGESGSTDFFLDMEVARTRFEVKGRVGKRAQFEGEVTHIQVGPGFLDHTVREYHRFFGLDVGSSDFPDDAYSYRINGRGIHLDFPEPGASLSDTTLKIKYNFMAESAGYPSVSMKAALKFPTGGALSFSGAGSTDFGLSFLLSKRVGSFVYHLNISSIRIFNPGSANIRPDPLFYQGMAGLEWVWSQNLSLSFQVLSHIYPFSNTGIKGLDNLTMEEVIGFKYRLKCFQFDFGFIEDTSDLNFSPDFSVLIGVSYKSPE